MINNKKVVAVLPAYNAAKTLKITLDAIPMDIVDDVILVDDASKDDTVEVARKLGLKVFVHPKNRGYGGNQKTCYREALKLGADIAVMVHPDFQYDPVFIPQLIAPLANGECDAVFGSRMKIRKNALKGGMPYWKFIANIALTKIENFILGNNLTEYHSGFRAYSKKVMHLPLELNSDDFVFDTEIIVQMKIAGLKIKEIPITTKYFPEASQISFKRSTEYGLAILAVMSKYLLFRSGIKHFSQFSNIKNSALKCLNCGSMNSYIVFPATADINNIFKDNSYKVTDSVSGKYGNIYKCFTCGIYFIDRQDLSMDFNAYYAAQCLDHNYVEDESGRRKAFNKVLGVIKDIQNKKNVKLLDIGCGPGFFLAEAKKKGFDVYGIDLSLEGCKFAKENLKLENIVCGSGMELEDNFKENFDVVSAFDVIEHLPDPAQFLRNISNKIDPDGLVVIVTPLIDSLFAKLLGKRWYALIPSHLTYFTDKSFRGMCGSLGLTVIRKRYHTKYLSLNYLLRRLFKKQNINLPKFLNFIIPINFYDEAEFYLKKKK